MRKINPIGPAVDSAGNPVIDPTENVKALTEAEARRQDDLRKASDKYNEAEIRHSKELNALRSIYEEKLNIAEAKRIDAIRAVDVNAVAIASKEASAAASVLADSLNKRISAVEKSQYEGQGKSVGMKDFAGWIVAAIAIIFYLLNYLK